MKNLVVLFSLMVMSSTAALAAPQYTLQQICTKYGKFGQCSTVPFCQEIQYQMGCYLANGAPAYMEAMCKLQTQKQGCAIMQSQGNCVWVEQSGSVCNAKMDSL